MNVFETIQEMKTWSSLNAHQTIGFVPTMGALHEGHLSLVRIAKKNADCVVVSIFVNPLQFGPQEDLSQYPKPLEKDLDLLDREKVDVVFTPSVQELYGNQFASKVSVPKLSQGLCGKSRPGHFDGVATVVTKLLNIVGPTSAIFGDKDFQQRKIIEQVVKDLNLDIKIIPGPIIRESDGLAMSSRNVYLSSEDRKKVPIIYQALLRAQKQFQSGERKSQVLIEQTRNLIDKESPTHINYVEICDAETLEEVSVIQKPAVLAVAVFFGKTRLIDNIILK